MVLMRMVLVVLMRRVFGIGDVDDTNEGGIGGLDGDGIWYQ